LPVQHNQAAFPECDGMQWRESWLSSNMEPVCGVVTATHIGVSTDATQVHNAPDEMFVIAWT